MIPGPFLSPREKGLGTRLPSLVPRSSFSFNQDGEKLGLVHTVCACTVKKGCAIMVRSAGFPGRRGWNTVLLYFHLKASGEVVNMYWWQFLL